MAFKNDPTYKPPDDPTIGENAKRAYEAGVKGIFAKVWDGAKQVIDSNFGMGVLLTGAAIVASLAIFGSWGPGQNLLSVSGAKVAETGFLSGIEMGVRLISPLAKDGINYVGLGVLAAGGVIGRLALPKIFKEPAQMSAAEATQKAKALGIAPTLEPGVVPSQAKPAPEKDAVDGLKKPEETETSTHKTWTDRLAEQAAQRARQEHRAP